MNLSFRTRRARWLSPKKTQPTQGFLILITKSLISKHRLILYSALLGLPFLIAACSSSSNGSSTTSTDTTDCGSNIISACRIQSFDSSYAEKIEPIGDVDYFLVAVAEEGILTVSTSGTTGTTGQLYVGGQDAPLVSHNGAGGNFRFSHPVVRNLYFIRVSGSSPTETGPYRITVSFTPAPGSHTLTDFSVSNRTPIVGQDITLSVNVSCDGGDCPAETLSYYSSSSEFISSTDEEVGSKSIAELSDGESRIENITIRIDRPRSHRFYGACIEEECSEGVRVEEVPPAAGTHSLDPLTISNTAPNPGQSIDLDVLVRCGGGSCASTTLRYYRSQDDQINSAADTEVGAITVNGLFDGSSQRRVLAIMAEDSGTHYYGACIETVCTAGVRVEVQGVLSLMNFNVSDRSPETEQSLSLSVSVSCQGGSCPNPRIIYYRSANNRAGDADDIQEGQEPLARLSHNEDFMSNIFTRAQPSGVQYYFACVASECSNLVRVEVQGTFSLSDFRVNRPSVQPGASIELSVMANCADGPCPATAIDYYLSSDNTIDRTDILVGDAAAPSLTAGGNSRVSLTVSAPTGGTYYYGACWQDECTSGFELRVLDPPAGSHSIGSSLTVNETTPSPDAGLTLSATLACNSAPCGIETVTYYRSSDSHISSSDSSQGTNQTSQLDANQLSLVVTTPTRPGIYYYGACIEQACSLATEVIVTSGPGDDDGDGWGSARDIDDDGDGLIEVANPTELDQMRYQLDGSGHRPGSALSTDSITDGCGNGRTITRCHGYELVANISLADMSNWQPIAGDTDPGEPGCQAIPFLALFEGNGFTIKNVTISRPTTDCIGLFGRISPPAEIRNLHLTAKQIQGNDLVAPLVADANSARIINVSATAESISGNNIVGGLIGSGGRYITITSSSAFSNHIEGGSSVGGLIGYGELADIAASVAYTNQLNGLDGLGGLVGRGRAATVISSYAATNSINGSKDIGGLVGLGRDATIIASYAATGSINQTNRIPVGPYYVGGLVGDGQRATIASSYAMTGGIGGIGNNVDMGGLAGWGSDIRITSSYAVTGEMTVREVNIGGSTSIDGLVGRGTNSDIRASYWDRTTSGRGTAGRDDSRSTTELQAPTTHDGIYDSWANGADISVPGDNLLDDITRWCDTNLNGLIDSAERVDANLIWDFGRADEYPAIRCTTDELDDQRNRLSF